MNELIPIEHQNQRILTTQQLADNYGTDTRRISENFNANKDRYAEGKHYYCLENDDLRAFKGEYANSVVAENVNKLYLWTERGALLHAKSLNTEAAWDVYYSLVDNYFNRKRTESALPAFDSKFLYQMARALEKKERQIEELTPMAEFAERLLRSKDSLLVREFAKIMHEEKVTTFGEKQLYAWLRGNGYLMKNNEPYQKYLQYFEVVERPVDTPFGERLTTTTKITPAGQLYLYHRLKKGSEAFAPAPSLSPFALL
jgi:phage antirepressor YoqD-like protein